MSREWEKNNDLFEKITTCLTKKNKTTIITFSEIFDHWYDILVKPLVEQGIVRNIWTSQIQQPSNFV